MSKFMSDPFVCGFLVACTLALCCAPIIWHWGYERGRGDRPTTPKDRTP